MEEAAANFRQVLSGDPNDVAVREHLVEALTQLGGSAFSGGRVDEAARYYRELIELQPGNADLHNNFGILLVRGGDITGGIDQFQAALKADPTHQAARRNLDLARKKLKQ